MVLASINERYISLVKKRSVLLIIVFLLVSCSTPSNSDNIIVEQVSPNPSPDEDTSSIGVNNQSNLADIPQANSGNPIEQTSLSDQIQSLNLDSGQFKVVGSSQVYGPDTCLVIEQPGVNCVGEITPGYWVAMEANGLQFEYHADKDGKQSIPATPGISWSREGGAENYCDRLIIYLPDTALARWCQSGETKYISVNLLEILSQTEYNRLIDSLKKFKESTINQSSTGDAEALLTSLTIYGQGDDNPGSEEQQSILALAQDIFIRITP